ncbi:hypothetical protein Clacol_003284 [Clathrus columnatus]|uniref:Uncharacterized protein n=1 Tax=Clathrus columnatus TaxID=1419009 RepID=A0AAV5A354_9AGAM|nr:hypothetical protein Clacol_003284 [Clathrus columnatus]
MPAPHCLNGMVGTINAPVSTGNQSFNAFLAKAKALPSIAPVVVGSPILTGIGAFATAPPANSRPTVNTTSAVSSSSTSTSSSLATTSSPTPSPTSKSSGLSTGAKGGIIGGIVAVTIIIILGVLLFIYRRRGRQYKMNAIDQMRYHPPTQEIFHARSNPSMSVGRRRSLGSTADSLDRDNTSGTGSQTLNVKELAAEIARNMRQEQIIHELPQTQYPVEMPSPPLGPVPEHSYASIPSPGYNSQFSQPPTPNSATTLLSQQQQQQQQQQHHSYGSQSRQLPRPPPPSSMTAAMRKRPLDAMSVDTLPAYGPSH